MTMLKVLARKGSTRRVADYLTRGEATREVADYLTRNGRSLAFDSNAYDFDEDWSAGMDETRRAWGKDDPGKRSYYHIVISPDPKDHASLEQVRELVRSWMGERYPESEWVAHYHNDNGITHAHIVMNAVLPATGRKVHMSNETVRTDAMRLQEMSRDRGLTWFKNPRMTRTEDGWESDERQAATVGRQRREEQRRVRRERRERGEPIGGTHHRRPGSWIDETRDAIDESLDACRDFDEFRSRMEARGFGVRVTHRRGSGTGVTFTHPKASTSKGGGYRVKGWKLDPEGGAYSYTGILSRLQPNLADARTYASVVHEVRRGIPEPFEERLAERASRRGRIGLQEIVDAYAYVAKAGIGSAEAVRPKVDALRARVADAHERLAQAEAVLEKARLAVELTEPGANASAETRAKLSAMGLGTKASDAIEARRRAEAAVEGCRAELLALGGELDVATGTLGVIERSDMMPSREPVGVRGVGPSAFVGRPPVRVTPQNAWRAREMLAENQRAVAADMEHARWAARRYGKVTARVTVGVTVSRRDEREEIGWSRKPVAGRRI